MFEWDRRTQIVLMVLLAALVFGAGAKYAGRQNIDDNRLPSWIVGLIVRLKRMRAESMFI